MTGHRQRPVFDWIFEVVGLLLAWMDLTVWAALFGPYIAGELWGTPDNIEYLDQLQELFDDSLDLIALPETVADTFARVKEHLSP